MKCCYKSKYQTTPNIRNSVPSKRKIEDLKPDYFESGNNKTKSKLFHYMDNADHGSEYTLEMRLSQTEVEQKTPVNTLEFEGRKRTKILNKVSSEKLHEEIKDIAVTNSFILKGTNSKQGIKENIANKFKEIKSTNEKNFLIEQCTKKDKILTNDPKINERCFRIILNLQYNSKNFIESYLHTIKDYAEQNTNKFRDFCETHGFNLEDMDRVDKQPIYGSFFLSNHPELWKTLRENLNQALTHLNKQDISDEIYNEYGFPFAHLAAAFTESAKVFESNIQSQKINV